MFDIRIKIDKYLKYSKSLFHMSYRSLKNKSSKDIIKKFIYFSKIFYRNNKHRIVSILLTGSMARGIEKGKDVDLYIITKLHYDIFLKSKFLSFLKSTFQDIKIEVGIIPFSRLKSGIDKSYYLYDLKYNSKILAGADIKSLIPDININDLYPFEGFILIMNRSIDLINAVENFTSKGIFLNAELFKTAISRIQRACRDAYLIFNKQYHSDYNLRNEIFRSLGGQLCEIKTFNEAQNLLVSFFNEGLKITKIRSYKLLLKLMESRYQYPLDFRLYTFVKTRKVSTLFHNPIYDVYKKLLSFLFNNDLNGKNWKEFKGYLLQTFNNSPKLCLLSNAR